jgi:hypothetical protein
VELDTEEAQSAYLERFTSVWRSAPFKHILTHQRIKAFFIRAPFESKAKELNYYPFEEISSLPLPRLIDKFLEQHREDLTK